MFIVPIVDTDNVYMQRLKKLQGFKMWQPFGLPSVTFQHLGLVP